MKNNQTALVFILDKSGSMAGLEKDTIGGYNAMLRKQKNETGTATVTTVLFNHDLQIVHEALDIQAVEEMTEKDYIVSGMTALLDAIGETIQHVKARQKVSDEKVLFVITTDGMENSSKEFTAEKIKNMIYHQKERANWEFLFLGANIDAIAEAEKFGIGDDFAVNYHADETGVQESFVAIHEAAANFRQGKVLDESWKDTIEKDFQVRK